MRALLAFAALVALTSYAAAQGLGLGLGFSDLPTMGGHGNVVMANCLLIDGTNSDCLLISGTTTNALLVQ